jgi:hypothetical protein
VSPGSFAKVVRRVIDITRFRAHQMRRTFACLWLQRGGSLAALQELLGHSTIVTTQRYTWLTNEYAPGEAKRVNTVGLVQCRKKLRQESYQPPLCGRPHSAVGSCYRGRGGMAERLKAAVLKPGVAESWALARPPGRLPHASRPRWSPALQTHSDLDSRCRTMDVAGMCGGR